MKYYWMVYMSKVIESGRVSHHELKTTNVHPFDMMMRLKEDHTHNVLLGYTEITESEHDRYRIKGAIAATAEQIQNMVGEHSCNTLYVVGVDPYRHTPTDYTMD